MKRTPPQQVESRGSSRGAMSIFRTNRSYTVSRIRVYAMPGLSFSPATPHSCSQLSLFDLSDSIGTAQPEKCSPQIGPAVTVLCIQKRPTKRFASSSARSTDQCTDATGRRSGTAACSGFEVANSTETAGSTSTRCLPRQRTIFGGLLTLNRTTDGGSKNSDSTVLNGRAVSATCRTTSRITSSKTDF